LPILPAALAADRTRDGPPRLVAGACSLREPFLSAREAVLRLEISDADTAVRLDRAFCPPANNDVLDLDCGTGLFGPQLRPLARTLTVIDLLSNMLKKGEQRQLYDHLICGDIAEFLDTQSDAFDLAVAADVFVYIGDLMRVLRNECLACSTVRVLMV
jgi:SAM-dependent methyltransferase